MSKINFHPCMALDAICYFEKRNLNDKSSLLAEQLEFIKKINDLTGTKLDDNHLGMSTLCTILSTYTENRRLHELTLDDLINMFSNPLDISEKVRARISNEFWKTFMFPMLAQLIDGWAKAYVQKINILKEVGFEKAWETDLYPGISEAIAGYEGNISRFDVDELFSNIQKMKNINNISDCSIYVSSLSYPIAFSLYDNCFLTGKYDVQNISIPLIAHELMHGFASNELIKEYLDYVSTSEFLINENKKLNEFSGNEEEFCVAVENYLGYLSGSRVHDDCLENMKHQKNCPLSVVIFDMLIKEESAPIDYNSWLIEKFKSGRFPVGDVKAFIDSLF